MSIMMIYVLPMAGRIQDDLIEWNVINLQNVCADL